MRSGTDSTMTHSNGIQGTFLASVVEVLILGHG